MTAQFSDTFIYKDHEYALIGIKGTELFDPNLLGITPNGMSTACYRGYYSVYKMADTGILLNKLTLIGRSYKLIPIDGVMPKTNDDETVYRNLKHVVPFTGIIRLAKDFIEDYYIHMGFQKATAYKKVLDIKFENGKIVEIKDRSDDMEKKRGAFKKHYDSSGIEERIEEAFSLDLEWE
ncbi:MAG: hypothetical protein HOP30_15905 [Cyclobacteriaceae bacterium]|nr:hypothetical protein [Cyclobacteriaceae bacterium]